VTRRPAPPSELADPEARPGPPSTSTDEVRAGASEIDALRRRALRLERELGRAFDQAQNEADVLFAQYQLSQLVSSGGTPVELARAVIEELVRLAGAAAGAIWLGEPGGPGLTRLAASGPIPPETPEALLDLDDARAFAADVSGAELLVLGDDPPATAVLLVPPPAASLDRDGLRIAVLARHELAVAFVGARLREALDREREELRSVIAGATDAIVQVDGERRLVRLNPAAERLLGVVEASVVGSTCDAVLGCAIAGGHGQARCPLVGVIDGGEPIAYLETAVRGPHGEPVLVAGGYSRTPAAPGGPVRATAILRDISAARALEQLRDGFVATVSHELRTPIALVRGYAETILHLELTDDQQRAYVGRIQGVAERLAGLVEQILDVTHLEADPVILERAPVSFASLAARCRGDLAVTGAEDRLIVDLPASLPPIDVDSARIGRVLENLVGNALKYAPDGTAIRLRASVEDGWLVVTVDDEGVGVPQEERSLVLEPFHRAGNVRESRIPGTGLGLAICRRLVEAHGGRLWLGDRPDGRPGTRVSFQLPLLADARRTRAGRGRGREAPRA
jgi:PAS domain S-box-containing protein